MLKNISTTLLLLVYLFIGFTPREAFSQNARSIEAAAIVDNNLELPIYDIDDVAFYQLDGQEIIDFAKANSTKSIILRIEIDEVNDWEMELKPTQTETANYEVLLGNKTIVTAATNIIYRGWLKNDPTIQVRMTIADNLIHGHIFNEVGAIFETVGELKSGSNKDIIAVYNNPTFIDDVPPSNAFGSLATLVRGPYLQSGTPTSTVIKWRTNTVTDSKVWYGNSFDQLLQTESVSGSLLDHEITITNLNPNTTYYYAIGDSNGQLSGGDTDHYFTTAPTVGTDQSITAWILGDCGTGNANQAAVRDAYHNYIGNTHTDMILLLGDNAYNSGTDTEYQGAIFDIYTSKLKNSMVWSCPGNHDYYAQSGLNADYYDIFTFPTSGEAGGLASNTEKYYAFDYGNIHIISLDSHDENRDVGSPMLTWLENDLAATMQEWVVVIFHHPPYTKGSHNSDTEGRLIDMRENVLPILENYGVDLVLSGHSHSYERSKLVQGHYGVSGTYSAATHDIDGGDGRSDGDGTYQQNSSEEGVVYIVTGSAGKISSMQDTHPVMYYSVSRLGSTILEVNGEQMDVKFLNSNGVVEDYLTILQNGIPKVHWTNPSDQQTFINLNPIPLTAMATDNNGTISKVEFFVNGVSVGVDNTAPYSLDWTPPAYADYMLSVTTTDDEGKTNTSDLSITVQNGPNTTIEIAINDKNDDVEERTSTGAVDLTSSDLELVDEGGTVNQEVGLRFNLVNIPRGATITNAYLQFTTDEVESGASNLSVYGEVSDNSIAFSTNNFNVSCRTKTSAKIDWTPVAWPTIGAAGAAQQTPNLQSIIQPIVNRQGWVANHSMTFILTGSGDRTADSYDAGAANAPVLHVSYILPNGKVPLVLWTSPLDQEIINSLDPLSLAVSAIDEDGSITEVEFFVDNVSIGIDATSPYTMNWTPTTYDEYTLKAIATDNVGNTDENEITLKMQKDRILETLVTQSSDDAEEKTSDGSISLSSTDLELADESGTTNQTIGIRFDAVDMPKGAIIKEAYIQFTTDESESNTANLNIYGEAHDNAPTFLNLDENISKRIKTNSSLNWIPAAWTKIGEKGIKQRTPNLKGIVEEITNRPNWAKDNALAFIITGSGDRTAVSYNSAPLDGPKLHINYTIDNSCDGEDLLMNDGQINADGYKANQTIEANGYVAANEAVTFVAGTSITLKIGFEAKANSNFHAYISACTVADLQPEIVALARTIELEEATNFMTTNQLKLSPNPALDAVQVDYYLQAAKDITVQVSDVNGRTLSTQFSKAETSGWQSTIFETTALSSGLYFVTVKSDADIFSQRLVINRP